MSATWWWEAHDPAGAVPVRDRLTDPWPHTPQQAAEFALAHLMLHVGDGARVLAGWRVRAWADGVGEAWVDADAWLPATAAAG